MSPELRVREDGHLWKSDKESLVNISGLGISIGDDGSSVERVICAAATALGKSPQEVKEALFERRETIKY